MTTHQRAFRPADSGGPLGLLCSPAGLSLAGAPLLRRGVSGFAPRRAGELEMLMKAAFGDADLAVDTAAGLQAVADALNNDDLGRAMVAAARLRLPPLDWRPAERIARVEDALLKYDPDEPREERGRWTSGAGG